MVERIRTQEDLDAFRSERQLAQRLRDAITFCKNSLELPFVHDSKLNAEQRVGFERCLVENYLVKNGNDYFGKRDFIYLDLYGSEDLAKFQQSV
jgi:hypothetical protein